MATPYSVVFSTFTNLISDYSFLELTESELTALLTIYLKNSIVRFSSCKQNLSDRTEASEATDETPAIEGQFNITLTDIEILILAKYMIYEWLSPKLNTSDLLKQILGTKDYQIYSQANQIKELRELREDTKNEITRLLIDYTYGDITVEDIS